MRTLLHISASPRGGASESGALASAFLDAYRETHPDTVVETLNLWEPLLPQFGPTGVSAKMAVWSGGTPQGEQADAWEQIKALAEQFTSADEYLLSVPMWNSGVPYVFKQWVDIVTQPGLVFTFDPATGYTGSVIGKKAATIYTSGVYSQGVPTAYGTDFHSTYVKDWLRVVGVSDVTEIRFQPNVMTATPDEDRARALAEAREAGKAF